MSKQDRQGVRQATDLEQKYNFGKTFAEIMGIATDAQKLATEAGESFEGLDHDAIFALLTNNGEVHGLFRDDDGELYFNGAYIKGEKIKSEYIDVDNITVCKLYALDSTGSGLTIDKYGLQRLSTDKSNPIIVLNYDWLQTSGILQEMPYFDMFQTLYDRDITPGELTGGILGGVHVDADYIQFRSNIKNFTDYPTHSYDYTVDFGISRSGHVTGKLKVDTPTDDTHAVNKAYVDSIAKEDTQNPGCFFRTIDGEKEWVNPPMEIGVEYRTAERYNGKPVYVKKVDLGALPNTDNILAPHDLKAAYTIVDFKAIARNTANSLVQQFPIISTAGEVTAKIHYSASGFYVYTFSDLSVYVGEATIWYTKS